MYSQAARIVPAAFFLALLALGACSSSFGSGSSPPRQPNVIVLPQGQKIVCNDGSAPPCQ